MNNNCFTYITVLKEEHRRILQCCSPEAALYRGKISQLFWEYVDIAHKLTGE